MSRTTHLSIFVAVTVAVAAAVQCSCSGGDATGGPGDAGLFDVRAADAVEGAEAGDAGGGGNGLDAGGCPSCIFIFATSTTHDAKLGGLEGADAICTQLAAAAHLPQHGASSKYLAWLNAGDDAFTPRKRMPSGTYIRVDGVTVATSLISLVNDGPLVPIDLDEHGQQVAAGDGGIPVWTDSDPDTSLCTAVTTGAGTTCAGYLIDSDAEATWTGNAAVSDAGWTKTQLRACDDPTPHLYCVESR